MTLVHVVVERNTKNVVVKMLSNKYIRKRAIRYNSSFLINLFIIRYMRRLLWIIT